MLAFAPGTGKTPVSLRLLRDEGCRRTLIVAPKSVTMHWLDLMHSWFPEMVGVLGTGPAKKREKAREIVDAIKVEAALVLNYEAARIDVDALIEMGFDSIICDEAHRLKSRQAQVTKAMNAIAKKPATRLLLVTGTPILNRPEEIWSLLHLIDRHRFSSYWTWVRDFYETNLVTYGWRGRGQQVEELVRLRDGALERMREQLADVMLHRPLEDLLPDLPEVTYSTITVELDAEERALYDQLLKRTWAEIEGEILLIANEVSRMTRLRQVVSDVETLGATRSRPGSKIAAAVELISDLDPEQVVVLTWSRAAAERVAEETDGLFIHGGVDHKTREKILGMFRTGETRILAGTLSTLGEGVDGLQVARHMIRLDRDWTPARNDQAVARLRRSGQHRAVVVHDIVAHDTIDATVERALRFKLAVIDEVLHDLG